MENIPKELISKFKQLPIVNITPFTLQDFPNAVACILWFQGCNFNCKYCYNLDLVQGRFKPLPVEEVFQFLESRKGKLDGVVFSGGECTLYKELLPLITWVKEQGFAIKVDTNGSNPRMLEELLASKLVQYVALDYKAPFSLYPDITGFQKTGLIEKSLELLIHSDIDFELRTTIHTSLLQEKHIDQMLDHLRLKGFKGTYYLQNFKDGPTIANLAPQKSTFNVSKNLSTDDIQVRYRNFY